MSSQPAPRCRHIKVNGIQCGSPAHRNETLCYFHRHCRPITFAFRGGYHDYSPSEVILPAFEDAHSIQLTLRQVTELILRHKIDAKTASLMLYAVQIASSNLKRIDLEKPQPEEVVIDLVTESKSETPIAARGETAHEGSAPEQHDGKSRQVNASTQTDENIERREEDLPPGTIQACHRPYDRLRPLHREPEDATIQ
jgi:hypothetical protein